ncbi:MAG: transglutaminase domain-containing protein [Patescibacteria group bacterium]|nr:transglutaminase domain-containing protein [Patescibacteria group bacterium]
MNIAKRIFCAYFLFFGLFFCSSTTLLAAGNFNTSYKVLYQISETGDTSVTQKVSITNLTDDFYASEHKLQVGSQNVFDVWAKDLSGNLNPQVLRDEEATVIQVPFGAPVAGRGETYQFELGYKTDLCKRKGSIWRIDIPGVVQTESISAYSLSLNVPRELGHVAYIAPNPRYQTTDNNYFRFDFEKDQLAGGIRAGFGEFQVYSLNLKFYLENPLKQKAYLDMPLPPDILDQQKVIYQKLSPAPKKIYVDEDGNYLARYLFEPSQQQVVDFKGLVFVYPAGCKDIFSSNLGVEDIPAELEEEYTKEEKYWEVNNAEIKDRAEKLTDEDASVVQNLKSIYEYVVAHLFYSQDRLSDNFVRLGAQAALTQRENALCTEYADLFIALSRAAGIPARLVEGYAYSESKEETPRVKDALHAWIEVFIPTTEGGRWVQIDPTWGSTTGGADYFYQLDLAHVAFVRKGLSSTEPFLLADYEKSAGDWLEVHFGEVQEIGRPDIETELEIKQKGLAGFTRSGILTVRNGGQITAFDVIAQFELDQSDVEVYQVPEGAQFTGNVVELGSIPPWSGKKIHFKIKSAPFDLVEDKLNITTTWKDFFQGNERSSEESNVCFLPFWEYLLSWYVLIFVAVVFVFIAAGFLLVKIDFSRFA